VLSKAAGHLRGTELPKALLGNQQDTAPFTDSACSQRGKKIKDLIRIPWEKSTRAEA
jgi:hypothetical protein